MRLTRAKRTDCCLAFVYMEEEDAHDEYGDATGNHVCYIPRITAAGQWWPTFDIDSNRRNARVCQAYTAGYGQLVRIITELISIL